MGRRETWRGRGLANMLPCLGAGRRDGGEGRPSLPACSMLQGAHSAHNGGAAAAAAAAVKERGERSVRTHRGCIMPDALRACERGVGA